MSSAEIMAADWQTAAEQTLCEIAPSILGWRMDETKVRRTTPKSMPGAYVALMTPFGSVQLGLMSNEDGCRAIANKMIGQDPLEPIGAEETSDAMCEVLNILGGGIKGRLEKIGVKTTVGFPCYSDDPIGDILMLAKTQLTYSQIRLGSIYVALVTTSPNHSATPR